MSPNVHERRRGFPSNRLSHGFLYGAENMLSAIGKQNNQNEDSFQLSKPKTKVKLIFCPPKMLVLSTLW